MREDHVGGETLCWWRMIMLVEKDHVVGEGSCKNDIFAPKTKTFAQNGPLCVRSQHKSQQTIHVCQVAPDLKAKAPRSKKQVDVEIIGKL